ncbi:MAG TPA: BTAD domain-containing putative transcriptional regulator [Acidimicrobiales bacterium]
MHGRRPPQPSTIARPGLEARLDDALGHRLTCVVAGPGFGKSTLLSRWASTTPLAMSAWHGLSERDRVLPVVVRAVTDALRLCVPGLPSDLVTAASGARGPDTGGEASEQAQAYAGRICEAVAEGRPRPLVLVLDDLEALDGATESAAFVAALCRQAPPTLHIVLASRRDPPFPVARLRGQGLVVDLTAPDLAFTPAETAAVVAAAVGGEPASPGDPAGAPGRKDGGGPASRGDPGPPGGQAGPGGGADVATLAAEVHAATAGWPAAVRLTAEALARVPADRRRATIERLRRPGGILHDYLTEEVLTGETDAVRDLLTRLSVLDRFTPELAEALVPGGAGTTLAALVRRGLVVDAPGRGHAWLRVNALVRDVVAAGSAARGLREATLAEAAQWLGDHGQPAAALRCILTAGTPVDAGRLVDEWGPELLGAGDAATVLEALGHVAPANRTASVDRLEGDARQLAGDWDGAVACYARAAGDADRLPPGLAWRWGLIHHLRGRLGDALAIYRRGDLSPMPDGDPALADQALLVCWTATAHWLRGDAETCRALAGDTMERARRSGDDRALAAAHTVQALVAAHDGDRLANDTHYLRALDHAERTGDLLQIVRIRLNRGSRLNEEGFHDEAIAELDVAIGLADLGGYGALKGIALGNRGEARRELGRFEQAVDDLEAARATFQRLGSLLVGYALGEIGQIHAARGQTALAHAAFSEAIEVGRRSGDVQGLVPALAGLARLVAADDPARAAALAAEAVAAAGDGLGVVEALLAQGWAELAAGDLTGAAATAARAGALARDRRDRPALAEATELHAAAAPGDGARPALQEALALWEELRNPLGQGRVLLALARLGGPEARDLARRAQRLLHPLGARRLAAEAQRLATTAAPEPPLAVHCLGGFAVLRHGEAVPVGEWQSRKARDLVKVLAARDGRPVHRGVLLELLWPGEDPAQTGSRLSVALSTARAVLDPGKRHPAGWYLGADTDTVWLDVDHAEVDLVRFADLVARAETERKAGPSPSATDALAAAEVAYVGDAFPEDPYEDWTVSARERVRSSYIWVARTLASDAAAAGDTATAVRCYLRVLEHDAYDEGAHLGLVATLLAAGQRGEARRAYQAYSLRMAELGVEAAPFPTAGTPPGLPRG